MYALSIQQKAGIMRCSRFHSKSSNPSNPCYLIHLKRRRRKTRTSHCNVMFHIEPTIDFSITYSDKLFMSHIESKINYNIRSWYEVMLNTQIFLFELTKD